MSPLRVSIASFFVLAGCSSSSSTSGPSDGGTDVVPETDQDSAIADTAPTDTSTDSNVCYASTDWIFDFKSCASDADCTSAPHQTDCCGTQEIIGVSKSKEAAFFSCESAFETHLSSCGCPSGLLTAEDGKALPTPVGAAVHCTDFTSSGRVCMTYVP
jgi:hypothetical protein